MERVEVGKQFITAGKAIFTIHNPQGQQYTYRVVKKQFDNNQFPTYLVQLLTGPDNGSNYTYLGVLKPFSGEIKLTQNSQFTQDSLPVKVIQWAFKRTWKGLGLPEGYGMHAEGRCGRCGRRLTRRDGVDPEGYRYGFGPECWNHIQA